jgi:hypothetical protein
MEHRCLFRERLGSNVGLGSSAKLGSREVWSPVLGYAPERSLLPSKREGERRALEEVLETHQNSVLS